MQLWEQTSTGGFCGEVTEQAFQIVFVRRSRDCCITICNYIVILHSVGDRQPFVRKRQRGKLHAERIPFPETQPLKSATPRLV